MKKHDQSKTSIRLANIHVMKSHSKSGHLYILIRTVPVYLLSASPSRTSIRRDGGLR
jgi:hypothetical protein